MWGVEWHSSNIQIGAAATAVSNNDEAFPGICTTSKGTVAKE